MADDVTETRLAALLLSHRWAALATVHDGRPNTAFVAYAVEPASGGALLRLSQLARHTQDLLATGWASLGISEQDTEATDPQQLARVTLYGSARPIPRGADFDSARATYLARLPHAANWFDFGDFVLFRLVPAEARFVGGFAQAVTLSGAQLQEAVKEYTRAH